MPLTPAQIDAIALYHLPPGNRAALPPVGKIKAALSAGLTVLCQINACALDITVRDAKLMPDANGHAYPYVRVMEGWREPLRVWTKEQPE